MICLKCYLVCLWSMLDLWKALTKLKHVQVQVQLICQFPRALEGQGQTNYFLKALDCGDWSKAFHDFSTLRGSFTAPLKPKRAHPSFTEATFSVFWSSTKEATRSMQIRPIVERGPHKCLCSSIFWIEKTFLIALVQNPPFSTSPFWIMCHFELHFRLNFFSNIKIIIWGYQVSWIVYSFGGQLKVNLN
jgi:hypothetical protein